MRHLEQFKFTETERRRVGAGGQRAGGMEVRV